MKVQDDLFVCTDCLIVIANADYTALAMHPETEDKRTEEINAGLDRLAEIGHVVCGDHERDEEFSTRSCECCESDLYGARHHCVLLNQGD